MKSNGKIKIEKNIPVPQKMKPKYPFHELKVGESFFIAEAVIHNVTSASHSFRQSRAGRGWKFTLRSVDGGVRVWRIE